MKTTFAHVLDALQAEYDRQTVGYQSRGIPCETLEVDDDDRALEDSSGAELLAWADDLDARCGMDITGVVLDYLACQFAERLRAINEPAFIAAKEANLTGGPVCHHHDYCDANQVALDVADSDMDAAIRIYAHARGERIA